MSKCEDERDMENEYKNTRGEGLGRWRSTKKKEE